MDTDLSLASAHQAGDDLGCVKTSANISRTDEMGHVRAVLMDMDSLNCRLAHVPEQKILAHRVFTQPRSNSDTACQVKSELIQLSRAAVGMVRAVGARRVEP